MVDYDDVLLNFQNELKNNKSKYEKTIEKYRNEDKAVEEKAYDLDIIKSYHENAEKKHKETYDSYFKKLTETQKTISIKKPTTWKQPTRQKLLIFTFATIGLWIISLILLLSLKATMLPLAITLSLIIIAISIATSVSAIKQLVSLKNATEAHGLQISQEALLEITKVLHLLQKLEETKIIECSREKSKLKMHHRAKR